MLYLVDGHNLIGKLPGLSLQDIDDEMQLVGWLLTFCQKQRKEVEVFFDQAPSGTQPRRQSGRVTAHFVRQNRTADQAIQERLIQLGKAARNVIVVSSDRQVQASARYAHARVLSSEDFARVLISLPSGKTVSPVEPTLSPEEVSEWETLFRNRPKDSQEKI
jgi:uncharacterized protein